MKHKAKRLDNGEWIEGYFDGADKNYPAIRVEGIGDEFHLIDPSTLCQQVRGTEFFEGDIITLKGEFDEDVEWYFVYAQFQWWLQLLIGNEWDSVEFTKQDALEGEPTGRNIND